MTISLLRLRLLMPFSLPLANDESEPIVSRLPAAASAPAGRVIAHISDVLLPRIIRVRSLPQRFQQLEAASQEAEPALAEIEQQTNAAPLPLAADIQNATLLADNLIKRLAQCYGGIARSVVKHRGSEPASLFYQSAQRVMAMLARRQLLAYRASSMPSASSWRQLHALYRMTCDPSLQALNGDTAPIEHEYLGALLLAYLDPPRQARGDLDLIHDCARQLAAYAVVSEASIETLLRQTAEARFLVCSEEGNPGLPLSRLAANSPFTGTLLVDCSQVLAAIDRNLSRQPGKPVQPELAAPPALLQALRVALCGRRARRFTRTRLFPHADLVGGLDAVIHFLDGNTYTRRALDAPGLMPGGPTFATSEWLLIDESPDGFRVRFVRGDQSHLSAGQVVALQPRESSRIHVCLVRRAVTVHNHLELGLQLLSPQVSVVALPKGGHAIFLHSLPAFGPYAGLITLPGALQNRKRLNLKVHGLSIERRIGRVLEANEALEFVALEPLSR